MIFNILCEGFENVAIKGKKHKIKLKNGENVEVGVSNDGYKNEVFVVTDIKSGLAISCDYLEETAILSAKEKLEFVIEKYGSVDTFREKRLNDLKKEEK